MQSTPTVMKALVLKAAGTPLSLEEVPVPVPSASQVLIRVDSAPINPADVLTLSGNYPTAGYPLTPGIEGSGVVVSEGELQGKRVSFSTFEPFGAYAQYTVTEKYVCLEVDDNVSLQHAASSFVNPGTVIGFLEVTKKAGSPAVVQTAAASQLGRMLVRYFQANGVKVINVVRRQEQVDILLKEGAEHVLNSSDADFIEKLTTLAAQLEAKIAFDAIGGEQTQQILSALPNGSTLILYGLLSGKSFAQTSALDLFLGKSIQGFYLANWLRQDFANLVFLQAKVKAHLGTYFRTEVVKEFPLSAAEEAFKFTASNATAGKVLLRPNTE